MTEYIITFGSEVSLFWWGRLSGAVVLFVMNRYLTLSVLIFQMSTVSVPFTNEVTSCSFHVARRITG